MLRKTEISARFDNLSGIIKDCCCGYHQSKIWRKAKDEEKKVEKILERIKDFFSSLPSLKEKSDKYFTLKILGWSKPPLSAEYLINGKKIILTAFPLVFSWDPHDPDGTDYAYYGFDLKTVVVSCKSNIVLSRKITDFYRRLGMEKIKAISFRMTLEDVLKHVHLN